MSSYTIWLDYEGRWWDPQDPPEPEGTVEAFSPAHAAERYAEEFGSRWDDEVYYVVRENSSGKYFRASVVREWNVNEFEPVVLDDLYVERP